jgi:hypothetical protein
MNKLVTLTRDGKTIKALVRQMSHDVQLIAGKKYKHGSGKCWMVVSVEAAPEYNHSFGVQS